MLSQSSFYIKANKEHSEGKKRMMAVQIIVIHILSLHYIHQQDGGLDSKINMLKTMCLLDR